MLDTELGLDETHKTLSDCIDQLATRLLLGGAEALGRDDFERLSDLANTCERKDIAELSSELARRTASSVDADDAERKECWGAGLMRMQALLSECKRELQTGADEAVRHQAPKATEGETAAPLSADKELVQEFVTESLEHLSTIEGHILILERDEAALESLNTIFRAFHTIKGLAGFLEFGEIQTFAHEVETLLDLARSGLLAVNGVVVDVVLESADAVRHELLRIEGRLSGRELSPSKFSESLLRRIQATAHGERALEPATGSSAYVQTETQVAAVERMQPGTEPGRQETDAVRSPDVSSVRIDTGKLDHLMDMVGELVIAQTLIGHSPALAQLQDPRFLKDLHQLARITADVQKITTGMRMVPIGSQLQKTARLVRDLSRRTNKETVLETSGEDTELDKTIAEELSDPLMHMVRNSMDHGIETPQERIAIGKDPTAHIRIAAYHQSGQIVIEISDDGRGLNREKILAKARQRGLVQLGSQLSDSEIFQLIFEPGFSTAEKVTDISGRGVGMDVVRRHVQKLRGRIDIKSTAGEGTTFYLKLPLTLAIIEGLVVMVGEERYIVPIYCTKEILRPTNAMLSTIQGKGEMVTVHDRLLPVVRLHQRFDIAPRATALSEGMLVVTESEGRQFCLFVDNFAGKQEVVIKSLGQTFKDVHGIAGCAILGDGRVGLILDMDAIAKGRGQQ